MSFTSNLTSLYSNIFCGPLFNPLNQFQHDNHTGCHAGQADCRLSTSIYGHDWTLEEHSMMIWPALQRNVGFVLNQELVETRWAKCGYLWDGATQSKIFHGCGKGGAGDCDDPHSAFGNTCASGKPCTWDDPEVKGGACKEYGGESEKPTTHAGYQCFYPAPAIHFSGTKPQAKWSAPSSSGSKLREMIKDRIQFDGPECRAMGPGAWDNCWKKYGDAESVNLRKYNEIVVDELLFMADVADDPGKAVTAFVYCLKGGDQALKQATAMRDEYCAYNKMTDLVPVVAINNQLITSSHPVNTPFLVPHSSEMATVI
jgi:hypothetical protein